ncbi:MAG: hypothetical protein GXP09_11050 [Gammaproteobacteria bacterium]|nr:hypothetical protein [Gammaproteobacteria bacterium]
MKNIIARASRHLFLLALFFQLAPALANETQVRKIVRDYIGIAQDAYTPGPSPTRDEWKMIDKKRAHAKSFWADQRKKANKDFMFLKAHKDIPFSLTDYGQTGDYAQIVVMFTPPTGSKAPFFPTRKGRYRLINKKGQWKLARFEPVYKKVIYPVANGASVKVLLEAYFKAMQQLYPPAVEPKQSKKQSLFAIRSRTAAYWKLREKDIKTPSMRSILFFYINRPKSWQFDKIDQAGDFARADLSMDVGNPSQTRAKKQGLKRRVRYTLIRSDGNWHITDFDDLDKKDSEKAKREQVTTPTTTLVAGNTPAQTLETYLNRMRKLYGPNAKDEVTPVSAMKQTKSLWRFSKPADRAMASRANSLFMLFRPVAWTTKDIQQQGDTATVTVNYSFSPTNDIAARLSAQVETVKYQLTQKDRLWYLSGYQTKMQTR